MIRMAGQLQEVTSNVAVLPINIANVYLVGDAESWTLVDTGTPGNVRAVREAAEARFGPGTRPESILLSHGHFDHSSNSRELAELWDVPVYVHKLELPYLDGRSAYPPKDPTCGGAIAFLSRFFPSKSANVGSRLRTLEDGRMPAGMSEWEWHFTPGHTPGHVSYFRPSDRTLLAGDAFVTMDMDSPVALLSKTQQVSRPPAPMTPDWVAAEASVKNLAALEPHTLACGHGVPMQGERATMQLAALARNFPVPEHGRYVDAPARANENGVVWVPPPAPDVFPAVAAGVALAVVAGVVITARARKRSAG